eukprot:gnl/MRDRNA2_/MRDRNA2_61993_c0_seq1.p2 gnl/MRDRNA2_/MRDRNA2_61993_c0~~gnl/MRDRNA2_/MRDRNA2_61993_c0_seq1.p2  ORF type:complete len:194 (-),score=36.34 gnl/MRDRNA2_/MRDRNA2_61993_c0_seq1:32-613(-)
MTSYEKIVSYLPSGAQLAPLLGSSVFDAMTNEHFLQSAPLRFVRLGLAVAMPVGAALAAPSQTITAGSLASSAAAREALMDIASNPQKAARAARDVRECLPPGRDRNSSSSSSQQEPELPRIQGVPDVLAAVLTCLGLSLPDVLVPVAASHQGAVELCEMLVDLLDTLPSGGDIGPTECAAVLQHFFDELAAS